jgi:alpha-tubulin suppressor-like RCC1 family protein
VNGSLFAFGANDGYQLGNGTTANSNVPVAPLGASFRGTVTEVVAGDSDACAIVPNPIVPNQPQTARVLCWGTLATSPSIVQTTSIEMAFPSSNAAAAPDKYPTLAHGTHHACALDVTGFAWCWGNNDKYQLGDPSSTDGRATPTALVFTDPRPQNGGNPLTFAQIAAGGETTCALDDSGTAWCWGDNSLGSLGNAGALSIPGAANPPQATPQAVKQSGAYTLLVGGGKGTFCGQTTKGWECWGANDHGQAGIGDTAFHAAPVRAYASVAFAPMLSIGKNHSCLFGHDPQKSDYVTASCWGDNTRAQIGAFPSIVPVGGNTLKPIAVRDDYVMAQGFDVTNITYMEAAVGDDYTCAFTSPSSMPPTWTSYPLLCWGANDYGQLSRNATNPQVAPAFTAAIPGR